MLLLLKVADVQAAVVGVSTTDQVYPRLIPVHRVEHDLQQAEIHRSIISVRRLGNEARESDSASPNEFRAYGRARDRDTTNNNKV